MASVAHTTKPKSDKNLTLDFDNLKSFLELEVILKDNDMLELKVTVSNGRYFGITEVYDTSESLSCFANSLIGYPTNSNVLMLE